jgi:hypothetical protein
MKSPLGIRRNFIYGIHVTKHIFCLRLKKKKRRHFKYLIYMKVVVVMNVTIKCHHVVLVSINSFFF